MNIIAVTAVILIATRCLLHNIIKMLYKIDIGICTSVNYKGKSIPAIGGIVFVPILLVTILLLLLQKPENTFVYISFLALTLCMGFAGVVDDLIGDRRIKGFVNHLKSTLNGTITTGFIKALTGFLVSCIISFIMTNSYIELIVNVLIISLFTNTINIFDLRPGRAVKVFVISSFMLLFAGVGRLDEAMPLIILNLAALLYIRYDLKEICMLGDTGANILGIALGYYTSLSLVFNAKVMILVLLVFLNITAEKLSINSLINDNRVLSYIDGLGREKTGNR